MDLLQSLMLTKIKPPLLPEKLVKRTRLVSMLAECTNYRLTLVSAGAGYGKTTLLTHYAQQTNLNLCWYALDEGDRDPAIFCRYLLASVRQLYPDFGTSFANLLNYNLEQLHQEAVIFRLAEEFVHSLEQLHQEVHQRNPHGSTILIALDDFQFAESFGVNRFVKHLLQWLPNYCHVIIASRALPQELSITKLLAKQMFYEINSEDLAFTTSEVSQLFQTYGELGSNVSPNVIEMLSAYSEGWITAIILALSQFRQQKTTNIEQFVSANLDINQLFDYLMDEVLSELPSDLQNFLVQTSIFDEFSAIMCSTLISKVSVASEISIVESNRFITLLITRNLFLSSLGNKADGQSYFQYHSLFREFLRIRLQQNNAFAREVYHRGAEVEISVANNTTAAIKDYILAEQFEKAALLLNDVAGPLYQSGRSQTINDLMVGIPESFQAQMPRVSVIKARLALLKGDHKTALLFYKQAESLFVEQGLNNNALRAKAGGAELLVRMGQRQAARETCQEILVVSETTQLSVPQLEEGQQAIALAHTVLATINIEEGNIFKAQTHLSSAVKLYQSLNDDYHLAGLDTYYGQLYQRHGQLAKSSIYYESALTYFVEAGNRPAEAYCRTSLAVSRYMQRQFSVAEKLLEEVLDLHNLGDQYLRMFIMQVLGNIYRDTERFTKADQSYEEALYLAQASQISKMELLIINDQVTNLILQDKKNESQTLIHKAMELAKNGLSERLGLIHRNQGWLDYTNRSYKRALAAFERAVAEFVTNDFKPEEISSRLGMAIAFLSMGEYRKALAIFDDCLKEAEKLGYDPFLPFEMRLARPLLEYASRKKMTDAVEAFLRRINYLDDSSSEATKNVALPIPTALVQEREKYDLYAFGLNGGKVLLSNQDNTKPLEPKWRTNKSKEALFFLLENTQATKDQLIDALWPEKETDTIDDLAHLLHNTLSYLRRSIAPIQLKHVSSIYFLDGELWYDAIIFSEQIKVLVKQPFPEINITQLKQTLSLYKQDFLPEFYADWITAEQQELIQLYISGLSYLAKYYEWIGNYKEALDAWQQIIVKDDYNEEAHQAIIKCWLALDNKVAAQKQLSRYLAMLNDLKLPPSDETTKLLKVLVA